MAAGGAHVVDDANVETPGACHLETWLSRYGNGSLLNLSPACTSRALPQVELGAALQRTWGSEFGTVVGPTLKIKLRSPETGLGFGMIANAAWSTQTAKLDVTSLIVPVSLRISRHLRANINAGWLHALFSDRPDRVFLGAQIEADIADGLMVMGEAFTRGEGRVGGRIGLRWSPVPEAVNIDLLTGWRTEGRSPWAVTIGVTVRR